MPPLIASLVSLFFFSGFAVAQTPSQSTGPNCEVRWNWTFNSLSQSPCTVAAYMLSPCVGGPYTLVTLTPQTSSYGGPFIDDVLYACLCSTVTYSLLSACSVCQGIVDWRSWPNFAYNCTTSSILSYPYAIPSGTRIPQWALLDVTQENTWDAAKSNATGGYPELGPNTTIGISRTSVYGSSTFNTATSNTASSNTATSNSATVTPSPIRVHKSNVGALAGGISGGIIAISAIVSMLCFYRRGRRLRALSTSDGMVTSILPEASQAATTLMKPYNPDDPATFPENLGAPDLSHVPAQVSSSSHNAKSGAQKYHGLPIV